MTLSELCVRRPVFTTMLIALPVVLGALAYSRMGVDLFPNVDLPIVTITITPTNPPTHAKEHIAKQREITEITNHQIKDTLSSLSGVGSITLAGGRKRAIQVTVDAKKLEAYHLSIEQVRQSLANQ